MLNPEHLLIPYQCAELPPGPWLVFAPHADDETYGMGGTLLKARDAGIETHVIILTDGAEGGNREDLVEIRKQEVQAATKLLGVESLQCWQEPDRGLSVNSQLVAKIGDAISLLAPASVFFPGPLEIHPDHRATAFLVWSALQNLAKSGKHHVPISYEISVQNPINFCIDISTERAAKEKVMAIYGSQNSQNNYQELVLALDKARTFSLLAKVSHAEGFYRFSIADLGLSLEAVSHSILDLYLKY